MSYGRTLLNESKKKKQIKGRNKSKFYDEVQSVLRKSQKFFYGVIKNIKRSSREQRKSSNDAHPKILKRNLR